MTTVSGTNIDEVPGIIDAVVAAGANVFAFARYCPTSEEKDVGIEPLRYRKLLADCDKNSRNMKPPAARPTLTKKTTCGRCTGTKPGRSKFPKPWRTV